jgi:hypothetical protein
VPISTGFKAGSYLAGFVSLGGTELANDLRTYSYIREECLPGWEFPGDCECAIYDGGPYISVADDPAPWYAASDVRSTEFLGLILDDMRLLHPFSRNVTKRAGNGSALGALRLGHRVVVAEGVLVASTCDGMSYGQRWVNEVMRRRLCSAGCAPDDLCIATHCELGGIRMLRNTGVVDGPVFTEAASRPDCTVQRIGFQIASEMPFLYAEPEVLQDAVTLGATTTDLISTDEWVADKALRIVLTAGDTDATDLSIVGRIALAGACPDERVPACIDISIPTLPANSVLTIDSTRQQVTLRDPITLQEGSGLALLEWTGAFPWPEVPACTDLCLTVDNGGAVDVTLTVESYDREI